MAKMGDKLLDIAEASQVPIASGCRMGMCGSDPVRIVEALGRSRSSSMTTSGGEPTRGFLADLHEADQAVVLQYTQVRLYEQGDFAVRRGEVDRGFFIISRGSFEVLVLDDGTPQRVRVLEPGDLFGEVGSSTAYRGQRTSSRSSRPRRSC